jgi:hypothetical protein
MDNNNKVLTLLEEINRITLNEFLDKLEWEDIKHYRVKQPSGTPIYRHFVTIPQYYLKGSKDKGYCRKQIYGGKIEDHSLDDINYKSHIIHKIKESIK